MSAFPFRFSLSPPVEARITPLFPDPDAPGDDGYVYGDFLWDRMQRFPNFHGVGRRQRAEQSQ